MSSDIGVDLVRARMDDEALEMAEGVDDDDGTGAGLVRYDMSGSGGGGTFS